MHRLYALPVRLCASVWIVAKRANVGAARNNTRSLAGQNIYYLRDEFRFLWKRMSVDMSLGPTSHSRIPTATVTAKISNILHNLDDDSWKPSPPCTEWAWSISRAARIGIEKHGDSFAPFDNLERKSTHQFAAHPSGTAEFWWDALECGVDDILPSGRLASRLCEILKR